MTFVPNGNVDFYDRCFEPGITMFPTDPQGGTVLSTGEENSVEGRPAERDGGGPLRTGLRQYPHRPNGYLTFGSQDSTSYESFENHFELPRIAGVFDNLEPGPGTISWLQLEDRVVVTWKNVLEEGTDLPNTFQIEMFTDDARIRMSWHGVGTRRAMVGLSAGNGAPDDFVMSDLSDAPPCARPPFVRSIDVDTQDSVPVSIVLPADDDGLPGAPTYRITGLPAIGVLTDDGSGQPILVAPHDLVSGGNSVTYVPVAGHHGVDGFEYRVDDGGDAPSGGESLPATVAVTVLSPVLEEFLTDDTDPGWMLEGGWEFGVPQGGGTFPGDPSSAFTGQNVFGYNLDGDYPDNMSEEALTSSIFSLAGVSDARLQFKRWLGVDFSLNDHAAIEILVGFNWQTVWEHDGPPLVEDEWSTQTYDISMADGQPATRLRWIMGETSAAGTYAGWNIDDIRIAGSGGCVEPPGEALEPALRHGQRNPGVDGRTVLRRQRADVRPAAGGLADRVRRRGLPRDESRGQHGYGRGRPVDKRGLLLPRARGERLRLRLAGPAILGRSANRERLPVARQPRYEKVVATPGWTRTSPRRRAAPLCGRIRRPMAEQDGRSGP